MGQFAFLYRYFLNHISVINSECSDMQAELNLCFWHMPADTFSHCVTQIMVSLFQVILDTFQIPHILVRRMLRDSVRKYGITEFPSMYVITRDGMFNRIAK